MDDTKERRASVNISNCQFEPLFLKVEPATEIAFLNNDDHPHTVTSDDGSFDSGDIETEQNYIHVFEDPGIYNYHCKHHPEMKGQIAVEYY